MDERTPTPPVSLDVLTAVHTILNQCSLLTSAARGVEEGQDLLALLKRATETVMKLSKRLHGDACTGLIDTACLAIQSKNDPA